jgi:hypothetical protein
VSFQGQRESGGGSQKQVQDLSGQEQQQQQKPLEGGGLGAGEQPHHERQPALLDGRQDPLGEQSLAHRRETSLGLNPGPYGADPIDPKIEQPQPISQRQKELDRVFSPPQILDLGHPNTPIVSPPASQPTGLVTIPRSGAAQGSQDLRNKGQQFEFEPVMRKGRLGVPESQMEPEKSSTKRELYYDHHGRTHEPLTQGGKGLDA